MIGVIDVNDELMVYKGDPKITQNFSIFLC